MTEIVGLSVRALDRARMSRDARFDGKFFIAITSTGIYCRPICPSPHAKRSHVRYYPTAAAAAADGYRPCLRCRPEAAPGTPAWLGTSAVVRRALRLIEDGFLDHESVDQLAERLGIGARHLHRLFLQHVGAPPIEMAQTRRLHFAKRLLDETELPITEIAFAAGFQSIRRFNSAFHDTFHRAPRELRRRDQAENGKHQGEVTLRLAFRPPYDWTQVRDFFAGHMAPGVERVDEKGYARTVRTSSGYAVISVGPAVADDELTLRVRGAEPAALLQISSTVRRIFDVAADPALILTAFQRDPLLAPLVKRRPGLRIPGAWDVFECAVRTILGQQVSTAAARKLVARLIQIAGPRIPETHRGLKHLFPSPEQVLKANLSGIGITRTCAATLQALARAIDANEIDLRCATDKVCERLSAIGIGDWIAQYVALRALGEPDAFPTSDLVLRRMALPSNAGLSVQALESRAEAWRPWRGYAAVHLWCAAADLPRFKPRAGEPV